MEKEAFEEILQCIELPLGKLLSDDRTYRITSKEFNKIPTNQIKKLCDYNKFLVLSNGQQVVVGGILFYGNANIQATIFPEYKGKHFMSAIHKNGILKAECYPDQKVFIDKHSIESYDDFCMKHYLLSCAELEISNLADIHDYFNMFKECEKLRGFQQDSLVDFVERFSLLWRKKI